MVTFSELGIVAKLFYRLVVGKREQLRESEFDSYTGAVAGEVGRIMGQRDSEELERTGSSGRYIHYTWRRSGRSFQVNRATLHISEDGAWPRDLDLSFLRRERWRRKWVRRRGLLGWVRELIY
ncbi:MAG: hypothetical protein OHK0021_23430 [Bryobacter sp.]